MIEKCPRVCDLVRAYLDPKRIPSIVGISLSTVYNNKKRMDISNDIQRNSGSGGTSKKWKQGFNNTLNSKHFNGL